MLGWMQGGYNVAPLVEALELDQDSCIPRPDSKWCMAYTHIYIYIYIQYNIK